jgi:hypothetical protein
MFDNTSAAMAKLYWSSPSQPRAIIPASQLIPVAPPSPDPRNQRQPAGVLLVAGSFIARRVHAIDESRASFSASKSDPTLPILSIARINFHELPPDKAALLEPGRTGLLLQSGDFVDGDVRGVNRGKVDVNSILFGLKRFAMDTALAAVLRDPLPMPATFKILSRDQSIYLSNRPILAKDGLTFQDPNLAAFKIRPEDLLEIRRMPAGVD